MVDQKINARRGKNNKRRGDSGEREVAFLLQDYLGIDVKRKLGQARDSGHDIDLEPFSVEVKRRKKVGGLYQWLGQAIAQTPVVMLRADGKGWLVTMYLEDWIRLAREEICEARKHRQK